MTTPAKDKTMKREITRIVDNNTLYFECENDGIDYLDTKVSINDTFFCWITYKDIDNFMTDFKYFMAKYRI